jgi:hypothetical protein
MLSGRAVVLARGASRVLASSISWWRPVRLVSAADAALVRGRDSDLRAGVTRGLLGDSKMAVSGGECV